MLPEPHDATVYLCREFVDFRKSINGLAAIVEGELALDPFDRCFFVFCNRKCDKIKILYWLGSGFALWYFRLEKERFVWPRDVSGDSVTLDERQLSLLLDGYDITPLKPHETLDYESVL